MIKEAMEYFLGQTTAQKLEINGAQYTDRKIYPVKLDFAPTLELSTLAGLKACVENPDFLTQSSSNCFALHVRGIASVSLISQPLGGFEQRNIFAVAEATSFRFPFDNYCGLEQMAIDIMSSFAESEGKKEVLSYLGGLARIKEVKMLDDGVGQSIIARTGITRVGEVEIKNPVPLLPYRSFPEIEPVPEDFIFRLRRRSEDLVECALFKTQNERWRVETIARIKAWLIENIPGAPVLA